ncbi:unnamed protein product [Linum trigynum]|uniref:Uncharacterized protein n=1 Tax=Linum trigynum TaxID=586398 RepID=A0AAV2D6K5_9ROSI
MARYQGYLLPLDGRSDNLRPESMVDPLRWHHIESMRSTQPRLARTLNEVYVGRQPMMVCFLFPWAVFVIEYESFD